MTKIERLILSYERQVSLPWEFGLAAAQRVWFAVYDKTDERRLRARVEEFEIATKKAHHSWIQTDITDLFSQWMAGQEYRESFFEDPASLELALKDFENFAVGHIQTVLSRADTNTVVAVLGVATLFGLGNLRVSSLIEKVRGNTPGRLLVFFPGEYENNNYHLLDARDGWNYLAVPITAQEGGSVG